MHRLLVVLSHVVAAGCLPNPHGVTPVATPPDPPVSYLEVEVPPAPRTGIDEFYRPVLGLVLGGSIHMAEDDLGRPLSLSELNRPDLAFDIDGNEWVHSEWSAGIASVFGADEMVWTFNLGVASGVIPSRSAREMSLNEVLLRSAPESADEAELRIRDLLLEGQDLELSGYPVRLGIDSSEVRILWVDPQGCETSESVIRPAFGLVPSWPQAPHAIVALFDHEGRHCSAMIEADEFRATFTIERGCLERRDRSRRIFSGGLSPTDVMYPDFLANCAGNNQ